MKANFEQLLGKFIRVKITRPIGAQFGNTACGANYGEMTSQNLLGLKPAGVFVLGLRHPVRNFNGRVIALITCENEGCCYAVAAPKNHRYIVGQIRRALRFAFPGDCYAIQCLYERSCGAVVFNKTDGELRFLLIKNRRSANWGFPKGHVENHESAEQTAKREVLEETGLRIKLLPGFSCHAQYTIGGHIEKSVTIFLGEAADRRTVIQPSEIEDYLWLEYDKALQTLKFDNDRNILRKAHAHLMRNENTACKTQK